MPDRFVVEEQHDPIVFSDSPDSPAADYLVEHTPRSIGDLYRLGIIHPSIPREDLEDIQNRLKRYSVPDVVISEGNYGVISAREIEGASTIPQEVAVMQEAVTRASAMLVARGHSPAIAELTAAKGARFISPVRDAFPLWKEVQLGPLDLEVRGLLYVKRSINSMSALNVKFHTFGWIIPEGSHFLLRCEEMVGVRPDPLEIDRVVETMNKPGPHPPIEGYSDRLTIAEIQARVKSVTAGWR